LQIFFGFITLKTQVGESLQDSWPSVNILGSLLKKHINPHQVLCRITKVWSSWTTKHCGFSRLVGSTIGCVGWAIFEVGFVTFTTEIICLTYKWTWRTSNTNTCYVSI